jgi:hypothetical protein
MRFSKSLRQQNLDGLAKKFFAAVPEHAKRLRIRVDDFACSVGDDDTHGRCFGELPVSLLGNLQGLLCPRAGFDFGT